MSCSCWLAGVLWGFFFLTLVLLRWFWRFYTKNDITKKRSQFSVTDFFDETTT